MSSSSHLPLLAEDGEFSPRDTPRGSPRRRYRRLAKAIAPSKQPILIALGFVILLVFASLYVTTGVSEMWWKSTVSGRSWWLFSLLFGKDIVVPAVKASYGTYVNPAVLDACPGYVADNVIVTDNETRIELGIAANGMGCGIFGKDIERLTVSVTYETPTRLHVKITDASASRYEVPSSVFPRPSFSPVPPQESLINFKYTTAPEPFSFTVYRASNNEVLFSTAGHPIIFEDQYLRVKTSLPKDTNIYGLGEHAERFRLDPDASGKGLIRTMWSRDSYGIPARENLYGVHPVYFEHRLTGTHGVFLLNSNGMDVKLNTTRNATSLEYNVIGGVLDFYFLAGSETDPQQVAQQYVDLVGHPAEVPYWSLGLHQCRYGYKDFVDVANVISNYKAAGIPLETMWTDIDYMDKRRIFTVDPEYFPMDRMREIVDYLHAHNQHFVLMTDPAIGYLPDQGYGTFDRGEKLGVWLKNRNGTDHIGVVWPGATVYPDWFHPDIEKFWTNEFKLFYNPETGLDIDGAWIDMNEPASFCAYPCTDPFTEAVKYNFPPPRIDPAPDPKAPIFNDTDTSLKAVPRHVETLGTSHIFRRQQLDASATAADPLNDPPYRINNQFGPLSFRTANVTAVHHNNLTEYDTHNLYGTMMSSFTRRAMLARRPNRRPLIITRSTFAGAGRDVGKWLGDNLSTWEQYRISIAGMLNFASIFGVPMVGSDVCGFGNNATETLCARWATLGAFNPFYRNHNLEGMISQEFYIWPNTTKAAKNAIDIRYRLLDYIYTAFHEAHTNGTPVLSPLWYKYPKDPATFSIDYQFFYGPSILVSPVTEANSTAVTYYLPEDVWYDFTTHERVTNSTSTGGAWVTKRDVEFDQIPLHVKGGSIIPLRVKSGMTTADVRAQPFRLLVAPDAQGNAEGTLYLDDGETMDPPESNTTLAKFKFADGRLRVDGRFGYKGEKDVGWYTVGFMSVPRRPGKVFLNSELLPKDSKVRHYPERQFLEVLVASKTLGEFDIVLV